MGHHWQLLDSQERYKQVDRHSWCARCGALKTTRLLRGTDGSLDGPKIVTYCAPEQNWTEREPVCWEARFNEALIEQRKIAIRGLKETASDDRARTMAREELEALGLIMKE